MLSLDCELTLIILIYFYGMSGPFFVFLHMGTWMNLYSDRQIGQNM
jgi:hypothetical protein